MALRGGAGLAGGDGPVADVGTVTAVTRPRPSGYAVDCVVVVVLTIAPFLAIVASSFRAGSVLAGVGLFVAYAAGMGLLVGAAALAVALARPTAVTRLRRFGPALSRLAGVVLLAAGGYVAYYGWYELRGDVDDPVIAAAQTLQRSLVRAVEGQGAGWIGGLFVMLLTAALIVGVLAARRARRTSDTVGQPGNERPAQR